MKTKQIALLLAALLVFSMVLAGCGGTSASPSPDDVVSTPPEETPSDNGGLQYVPPSNVAEITPVPEGAIDFSDGNTGYLSMNLTPGGSDPSIIEIVDFNGAKALKVSPTENGIPYLGVDVSSMFGARVADIRTIQVRIYTESPTGEFYANAGYLTTWTGADLAETEYLWGIAIERNNPRTLTAELTAFFEPDLKNIMVITKSGDAALDANTAAVTAYNARKTQAATDGVEFTEELPVPLPAGNMIIDYMLFLDEAGNPIEPDTSVSFDAPKGFGDADRTLLYTIEEEFELDFLQNNATGSTTGAWGQAGQTTDLDFSMLKPGAVFTVYYRSEKAPEMVIQSWADTEVPASVEALNRWCKIEPYTTNFSGNIAQFRYEDIVAVCGDENFELWANNFIIGDYGAELTVNKFTIGQRVEEDLGFKPVVIGRDGFINLMPFNNHANAGHSDGNWTQCYRVDTPLSDENPGDFNPAWLVEGCYIVANYYSVEKGTQFIFQRFEDVDAGVKQIWGNVTGTSQVGGYQDVVKGIDSISYEGILAQWTSLGGGAFTDELGAFWIQDDGAVYDLFNLYLYTPNFNPVAAE